MNSQVCLSKKLILVLNFKWKQASILYSLLLHSLFSILLAFKTSLLILLWGGIVVILNCPSKMYLKTSKCFFFFFFISPKPMVRKYFLIKLFLKYNSSVRHEISHILKQLLGDWNKVSLPYVFHFRLLLHPLLWWLLRQIHPKKEFVFLYNFTLHWLLNSLSAW